MSLTSSTARKYLLSVASMISSDGNHYESRQTFTGLAKVLQTNPQHFAMEKIHALAVTP